MHCHRLHWKVSLFPHRQQDSKTCHVYYRASFAALTMAQRVHLLVGMGTRFLRTGSDWSRIFHLNVENMHLRLLKHWLNCTGFQTRGKEHYSRWCSDRGVSTSVTITAFVEKQLPQRESSQISRTKSRLCKSLSRKDSSLWEEWGFKTNVASGGVTPVLCFKMQWLWEQQGHCQGQRLRRYQCISFYLTDVSLYPPPPPTLLSSNHPHSLFWACSHSFPSFLIAVRWCHLDMKIKTPCNPPAVPSAGRPEGRAQISTGMDMQQSIYLYLIIRRLQEKESCTSTSPSRCLISHSFSYWIFLFKGALLRLTTSSAAGETGEENSE